MNKIIFTAVSLLALASVLAWQPVASSNHPASLACGGCTNSVSLACGCTNSAGLNLACGGCTNSVSLACGCTNSVTVFACGGCTNSTVLAMAGF